MEETYSPLQDDEAPDELLGKNALRLDWRNVAVATRKKVIISGCNGTCCSGELMALMGPSGAGKTTLLKALAGRRPSWSTLTGVIALSGGSVELTDRPSSAFVEQELSLPVTETPAEAVAMAALLRLPSATPRLEKLRLAASMLDALRLRGCADTLLGDDVIAGCSGGERRRCAVAIELVTSPKLLFLDEPTSGLDSYAAFLLVQLLHDELCEKSNIAVITTIHQPSSHVFAFFHEASFMREGRLVYAGPSGPPLLEFFARYGHVRPPESSPADFVLFVLQTCTDDEAETWVAETAARYAGETEFALSDGTAAVAPERTLQYAHASLYEQLRLLSGREARACQRNPGKLVVGLCVVSFMGTLVGTIFYNAGHRDNGDPSNISTHFALLYMINIQSMMSMSQPVVLTFPQDRRVLVREYAAGTFSLVAYITSKLVVEIPVALLTISVGVLIPWFLGGLRANFLWLVLTTSLTAVTASSTAMFLSTLVKTSTKAIQLAPVVLVPQMLFAGFLIPSEQIPPVLRWCQWLCSLKYGINLAIIEEFGMCHQPSCDVLFEKNQIDRAAKYWYIGVLLALFVGFRASALIALRWQAHSL